MKKTILSMSLIAPLCYGQAETDYRNYIVQSYTETSVQSNGNGNGNGNNSSTSIEISATLDNISHEGTALTPLPIPEGGANFVLYTQELFDSSETYRLGDTTIGSDLPEASIEIISLDSSGETRTRADIPFQVITTFENIQSGNGVDEDLKGLQYIHSIESIATGSAFEITNAIITSNQVYHEGVQGTGLYTSLVSPSTEAYGEETFAVHRLEVEENSNNGHGNNVDGVDSSNPGNSKKGQDTDSSVDDEIKDGDIASEDIYGGQVAEASIDIIPLATGQIEDIRTYNGFIYRIPEVIDVQVFNHYPESSLVLKVEQRNAAGILIDDAEDGVPISEFGDHIRSFNIATLLSPLSSGNTITLSLYARTNFNEAAMTALGMSNDLLLDEPTVLNVNTELTINASVVSAE